MFQLLSVPVLLEVSFLFWSSTVVLTPNGNFFLLLPVLDSVSDYDKVIFFFHWPIRGRGKALK